MDTRALIYKAEHTHQLAEEEIAALLADASAEEALAAAADRVRAAWVGDAVHLRGLIEFSSYCARSCFYCGLRKDNRNQVRYRLTEAQILEFIDMEHTPKNILIRAVKKRHAKEDNNIEASIKRCEAPGITDTGTSVGRVRHGVRKFRERSSGERG